MSGASLKSYFGIDVGATFTKFVLIDGQCRVRARLSISSSGFSKKMFFLKTVKEALGNLASRAGEKFSSVVGIGIGVPGPVETEAGRVISLTNIRGWSNFFLASYLKKALRLPVVVDNDANCMALAEARWGAARGARSALCVTLGTGVGGGLILDGRIWRGSFFFGGEVGHIPIAPDGPSCVCGGAGCLERYVGNQALLRRARELFGREISLEEVSRRARAGDVRAQKFWKETGEKIGFALAGVFNVFNPQVIVVGGGVAGAGAILLRAVRDALRRHAMGPLKAKVAVRRACLGPEAGVLGAALLARASLARERRL